jgi:hypothetical protein
MPRHIEPRRRNEVLDVGRVQPARRVVRGPDEDRLTRSEQRLERHRDSRHVAHLRELQRRGFEGVAEVACDTRITLAEVEGEAEVAIAEKQAEARVLMAEDEEEARRLSELKWHLIRAKSESKLAGDDLEIRAKFAELDDDYFQRRRARGL